MIRLTNVSKSYKTKFGPIHVLKKVNMTFPKGQSIGVLGLNGAGKSTLISILGGALFPDSGTILREGKISWPMGYSGGFTASLTGRENARFVARIYGADPDYIEDFTREFAELGQYFDLPLRSYSAGMKGRFAFSVSLACDFEYYLVDETMETGDARYREKFRKAFEDRRDRASVILVSHNEQTIRRNCDQAAILHNGKLDHYENINDAFHNYNLLKSRAA